MFVLKETLVQDWQAWLGLPPSSDKNGTLCCLKGISFGHGFKTQSLC